MALGTHPDLNGGVRELLNVGRQDTSSSPPTLHSSLQVEQPRQRITAQPLRVYIEFSRAEVSLGTTSKKSRITEHWHSSCTSTSMYCQHKFRLPLSSPLVTRHEALRSDVKLHKLAERALSFNPNSAPDIKLEYRAYTPKPHRKAVLIGRRLYKTF